MTPIYPHQWWCEECQPGKPPVPLIAPSWGDVWEQQDTALWDDPYMIATVRAESDPPRDLGTLLGVEPFPRGPAEQGPEYYRDVLIRELEQRGYAYTLLDGESLTTLAEWVRGAKEQEKQLNYYSHTVEVKELERLQGEEKQPVQARTAGKRKKERCPRKRVGDTIVAEVEDPFRTNPGSDSAGLISGDEVSSEILHPPLPPHVYGGMPNGRRKRRTSLR